MKKKLVLCLLPFMLVACDTSTQVTKNPTCNAVNGCSHNTPSNNKKAVVGFSTIPAVAYSSDAENVALKQNQSNSNPWTAANDSNGSTIKKVVVGQYSIPTYPYYANKYDEIASAPKLSKPSSVITGSTPVTEINKTQAQRNRDPKDTFDMISNERVRPNNSGKPKSNQPKVYIMNVGK